MAAMTDSATHSATDSPAAKPPFPPQGIGDFLRFCAGEWMSLNSTFALEQPTTAAAGDGDEWHSSERGELVVTYLEPQSATEAGGLSQGPKGGLQQQHRFDHDGSYRCGPAQGRWQLWPDGSLEIVVVENGDERRERLWFTKPNLRLRSSVTNQADGEPSNASFSSEIRRVSAA